MATASGSARTEKYGQKARAARTVRNRKDAWGSREAREPRSQPASAAAWTRAAKKAMGTAKTSAAPRGEVVDASAGEGRGIAPAA